MALKQRNYNATTRSKDIAQAPLSNVDGLSSASPPQFGWQEYPDDKEMRIPAACTSLRIPAAIHISKRAVSVQQTAVKVSRPLVGQSGCRYSAHLESYRVVNSEDRAVWKERREEVSRPEVEVHVRTLHLFFLN